LVEIVKADLTDYASSAILRTYASARVCVSSKSSDLVGGRCCTAV